MTLFLIELGKKAYREEDYETAFEYFSGTNSITDPEAQNDFGDMYYYGYGVTRSYEKAFEWFTKAADQEYAPAIWALNDRKF